MDRYPHKFVADGILTAGEEQEMDEGGRRKSYVRHGRNSTQNSKATVDTIYPVKWLFRSVTTILTRSVFGSKENRKISQTILELLDDNNF